MCTHLRHATWLGQKKKLKKLKRMQIHHRQSNIIKTEQRFTLIEDQKSLWAKTTSVCWLWSRFLWRQSSLMGFLPKYVATADLFWPFHSCFYRWCQTLPTSVLLLQMRPRCLNSLCVSTHLNKSDLWVLSANQGESSYYRRVPAPSVWTKGTFATFDSTFETNIIKW